MNQTDIQEISAIIDASTNREVQQLGQIYLRLTQGVIRKIEQINAAMEAISTDERAEQTGLDKLQATLSVDFQKEVEPLLRKLVQQNQTIHDEIKLLIKEVSLLNKAK